MSGSTGSVVADETLARIKKAAENKQLLAVIGTGVSVALTNGKNSTLSWKGLIENGFLYGTQKGLITETQNQFWKNQLGSSDIDDVLSAAEFMSYKLGAPTGDLYARWLQAVFQDVKYENEGMANAIRAMQSAEIPLCTLNYDLLLEQVTKLGTITFSETTKATAWIRRVIPGILHLHGNWDTPASCVLGIRSYEATVSDAVRDLIQRSISTFSQLLFIGCGDTFADPNFSALIRWLRANVKTAAPQHYALVKASEVAARHADPAWQGFVEPISYGATHNDLPAFLMEHFLTIETSSKAGDIANIAGRSMAKDPLKAIEEYRSFLVKDCGQMTIEGVNADMATAQRRFELEKLFVPLKLQAMPPELPNSDPEREQKLRKWHQENDTDIAFGEAFIKHKHLALLALPGGGKSLLLKRLAVAYADPVRRKTSEDGLPDLDIIPVLIRCREWRDYIRRPIPILLENIASITGQASLRALGDALIPHLEAGRVLLLVDGLDEIHNDADRSTFVEHLESFLHDYSDIRLVVTSREAGFSLVAPSIARFSSRWRVAPLEDSAIELLCAHWHSLMRGTSAESLMEAREVAQRLLQSEPLRRLAENPLLLTMLLVVKHGAGRLPPDRVSLYERAVEVLLDTWNIKGHEPLNLKEAVPQLAYVAFALMQKGVQTATEKELLSMLEQARDKVPQIRRYAKDTPDQFLKRVELRSSLLLEAGHQLEGSRTVPFYQFRHLTFQEYLAAVAAVEGHYIGYKNGDTVLEPLKSHLVSDEWKEVIPMAAVLAKKQAEPLIAELVLRARNLIDAQKIEPDGSWEEATEVVRLLRCLGDEAEASPSTLTEALQLTVRLAGDFEANEDAWRALARGPYGSELLHQTWLLYSSMQWPNDSSLPATYAKIVELIEPLSYWRTTEGKNELLRKLEGSDQEHITRALLELIRMCWAGGEGGDIVVDTFTRKDFFEHYLFSEHSAVVIASAWGWGLSRKVLGHPTPSVGVLDRLLSLWLGGHNKWDVAPFALSRSAQCIPTKRYWRPTLTETQKEFLRREGSRESRNPDDAHVAFAALYVSTLAEDVWPKVELRKRIIELDDLHFLDDDDYLALREIAGVRKRR